MSEPERKVFNRDNYEEKHGEGSFDRLTDCRYCNGNGWLDDPSDGGTMCCDDCDSTGKEEPEGW